MPRLNAKKGRERRVDSDPNRWQGWAAPVPGGPAWTDLSHVLNAGVSRVAMFPAPSFGKFKSLPGDPLNVCLLYTSDAADEG